MDVQSLPFMTVERFAEWVPRQERRYELVRGLPRIQPYVKRSHSTVVMNLSGTLWQQLDDTYHVATADFGVATGDRLIRFPDVMVFGADTAPEARVAADPILIAEVFSESTLHVDFGEKRHEYLGLDSLDSYLVFAQDKPFAWQWSRDAEGTWPDNPAIIEGKTAELLLNRFGLTIPLSKIYAGVN